MRKSASLVIFFLALFSVVSCLAQNPSASSETPVFRSSTELVLVPVMVHDKKGVHISGLKASDFTILENGKPQKIGNFEEVHGPLPRTSVPQNSLAAAAFSNSLPAEQGRGLVIIALDVLNFAEFDQTKARGYLFDYLARIPEDTPIAILVNGREGVRIVHNFTTDTRTLRAAVNSLKKPEAVFGNVEKTAVPKDNDVSGAGLAGFSGSVDAMNDLTLDAGANFAMVQRTRMALDAMEQIANSYAGVPGRKALIWISSSLPFLVNGAGDLSGGSLISTHEKVWRALNRADMAVYPVDAMGSSKSNSSWDHFDVRKSGAGSMRPIRVEDQHSIYDQGDQTRVGFENLAKATGGKACIGHDRLDECIANAVTDSREYYMLSFYATDRKPGWHKLEVKTNVPGVDVRSRTGFYVTETPKLKPPEMKQLLGEALASPINYTSIAFTVKVGGITPEGTKRRVNFSLLLAPHSFELKDSSDLDVEIVGLAVPEKGSHLKEQPEFAKNMSGKMKPESAARALSSGLAYKGDLAMLPGKYNLHFAVRDNNTGNVGTLTVPVEVN